MQINIGHEYVFVEDVVVEPNHLAFSISVLIISVNPLRDNVTHILHDC